MVSDISTLPVELVEVIAYGLEPAELLSLRLACRELNRKTFRCFGHAYFQTLRTNLSRESLQRLTEVSQHEHLRRCVKVLLIESSNNTGLGFLWNRHPSGHLVAPLPAVKTLREILGDKFVNCRSFRFHTFQFHSDYDAIDLDQSAYLTTTDTIAIILTIIAETGLPVESFHVDLNAFGGSPVDIKRLDILPYQTPEFRAGWACLRELILGYTLSHEAVDWTVELILRASCLQKLELGHHFDDTIGLIFHRLLSAETLPRLEELSILKGRFTEELLSNLVLRFRDSLRILSLCSIVITPGGTWPAVFRAWRGSLPLLERISVKHLRNRGPPKTHIIFPSIGDDPVIPETGGQRFFDLTHREFGGEQAIVGVAYRGPSMKMAFEILVRSTTNEPRAPTPSMNQT